MLNMHVKLIMFNVLAHEILPIDAIYWAACAPSHKMDFRSSAAKNGLPGEGRHEGLVPRNYVLTSGFIFRAEKRNEHA